MTLLIVAGARGGGGSEAPSESSSVLRFPSNSDGDDTSDPYAVIEFANPQNNGLPLWGASGNGVTVVMKLLTRAQEGFTAHFWWSQGDGSFDGATEGYWGFHPYPRNGSQGTTHVHEIASNANDIVNEDGDPNDNTNGYVVTHDVVRRQAFTVTRASANSKTMKYLFDITSPETYVQFTNTNPGYGESDPPSPLLTIGNSPWFAGHQHEKFGGDLYGIKIFTPALSEADAIAEAEDFSRLATAAGEAAIWWGKNGFDTVDDLTCDFGTGRSFTRDDSSNVLTVVSV